MKTQSSLEVPKQVRSASFDEIQLEAKRQQQQCQDLLRVPQFEQRSKSVDSGDSGARLEVPPPRRFQRRRSSSSKGVACVHCACLEEYAKLHPPEKPPPDPPDRLTPGFGVSDTSSSECDEETTFPECEIKVTLSPTVPSPPIQSPPPLPSSPVIEYFPAEDELEPQPPHTPTRRKSIHRQEAFFAEPSGNSLENMSDVQSEAPSEGTSEGALSEGDAVTIPGVVVRDIYLKVSSYKYTNSTLFPHLSAHRFCVNKSTDTNCCVWLQDQIKIFASSFSGTRFKARSGSFRGFLLLKGIARENGRTATFWCQSRSSSGAKCGVEVTLCGYCIAY